MKDVFGRGLLAGGIGVIAINIAEFIMSAMNISETKLWEAGGIIFLSEQALESPLGFSVGIASHIFVAIFAGIAISYYLYFSGKNFAYFKGIGVSIMALYASAGLIFPIRELNLEMKNRPGDVLAAFIDHILFGVVAVYTILYLLKASSSEKKAIKNKKNINLKRYIKL